MNAQKWKGFFSCLSHFLMNVEKNSADDFSKKEDTIIMERNEEFSLMKRYKVFMHNDDYTPMDFVVQILQRFFDKNMEQAESITMLIHKTGSAVVGVYSKEIAETKLLQVQKEARGYGYPLRLSIEKSQ